MKRAPNLKFLPKEKFTEAIIFAGADAYAHAKGWEEGLGKQIAEDTTPPVWLGPKQLAELDNLQIIDKGRRSARVYIAGNIEPILINAIGEKLARAGVQDARLYKGIPDRNPEDWHDYLNRVREQAKAEESNICQLPVTKRAPKTETGDELKPRVESRDDGVFWVTPKVDKETGEIINLETWLCSPIEVVGSGSDGAERYLVLRWHSPRGHEDITRAIPCADIGERDGCPESDARDLPIKELAGYRTGSQYRDEVFKFYTFPAAFEQEIARGFNHTQFARALASAGMLETGDKGRHKKKALRKMGGKQHVFYVLMFSPDDE